MIDSTNLPNAGPRPVGARAARRRLLVFPGSAVATGGIVALATWPRLPDVMVTHWGAAGADGWMPRAWAVGLPLAMSLIALAWNLVVAYARPRSIRGPSASPSSQACSAGSARPRSSRRSGWPRPWGGGRADRRPPDPRGRARVPRRALATSGRPTDSAGRDRAASVAALAAVLGAGVAGDRLL